MDSTAAGAVLNPALVGREEEMRLLRGKLAEAEQGRGSVVFVSGDAGVGKTRLVEEVEREAEERGMLFLRGAGEEQRSGLAYGALVEPLSLYLDQAGAAERAGLQEVIAELAPHLWSSLFPAEALPESPPAEGNPKLVQALFLARLTRLLLDLAGQRPVVFCLEDLQWADSASLQLLGFLSRRNAQIRLLLLGTYRPGQPEEAAGFGLHRMLQELQLKSHVQVLELPPFGLEQTRLLVDACLPRHSLGGGLIAGLQRQSGGVPFIVLQLLEYLVEKGALCQVHGRWVSRPQKEESTEPASIRKALEERLRSLPPQVRQVLSCAAVQGEAFEGRLVARSLGMPLSQVLRILGNLVRTTRLLRLEERRFRFAHALLAQAFYDLLPEEQRRQAHLLLGTILEEQRQESPELLAYHFFRARAFVRVLPHLLAAARRTRAAFAYPEMGRFLDQAEQVIGGLEAEVVQPHRLELLRLRADLEDRAGHPDQALALCRQVLELADPKADRLAVAQAMMQMGWVEHHKGNWEEAKQLYWDAQSIYAELDDELNRAILYLRLGNIAFERCCLEEAAVHYREAKATAIKCANNALLGSIYGNLGVVATVRGQHLEAVLNYTEAQKAYQKIKHRYGLCQTVHNLGMAYAGREEWQQALSCYGQGLHLAREMGTVDVEANILVSQAVVQVRTGDLEGAEASCRQARDYMEQMRNRLGLAECTKVEGMLCRARAQYAQAQELLQRGRHLFAEIENQLGVAECDLELGRLFQDRGELETARQHLQDSRRTFAEIGAAAEARRAEALLAALAS